MPPRIVSRILQHFRPGDEKHDLPERPATSLSWRHPTIHILHRHDRHDEQRQIEVPPAPFGMSGSSSFIPALSPQSFEFDATMTPIRLAAFLLWYLHQDLVYRSEPRAPPANFFAPLSLVETRGWIRIGYEFGLVDGDGDGEAASSFCHIPGKPATPVISHPSVCARNCPSPVSSSQTPRNAGGGGVPESQATRYSRLQAPHLAHICHVLNLDFPTLRARIVRLAKRPDMFWSEIGLHAYGTGEIIAEDKKLRSSLEPRDSKSEFREAVLGKLDADQSVVSRLMLLCFSGTDVRGRSLLWMRRYGHDILHAIEVCRHIIGMHPEDYIRFANQSAEVAAGFKRFAQLQEGVVALPTEPWEDVARELDFYRERTYGRKRAYVKDVLIRGMKRKRTVRQGCSEGEDRELLLRPSSAQTLGEAPPVLDMPSIVSATAPLISDIFAGLSVSSLDGSEATCWSPLETYIQPFERAFKTEHLAKRVSTVQSCSLRPATKDFWEMTYPFGVLELEG